MMENYCIQKPCIFITSGGRTATRFISEVLSESITDCFSTQEPDVWRLDSLIDISSNWRMWIHKLKDFGLCNMTVGKLFATGNLRGISLARQRGLINEDQAALRLFEMRSRFISRQSEKIYAECNHQLAGLIDILPKIFPNSKAVFMIRDGRDWVRSWFNGYFTPYGKRDPFYYLKSGRANATQFPDDPFYLVWDELSPFQKVCWLWRSHIEFVCKIIEKNPGAKIFCYEELFSKTNQTEKILDLLRYVTEFPDGTRADYDYQGQLDGVRFHAARLDSFPKWTDWDSRLVEEFQQICGDILLKQGYGQEELWHEKIAGASSRSLSIGKE